MILAVAEWQGRISPVFDVAENLKLYIVDGNTCKEAGSLRLGSSEGEARVELMTQAGIEILICGAISGWLQRFADIQGIEVISFISGNVDSIVDSYIKGNWQSQLHRMPGCRSRGRGRCGHGRRQRGRNSY